MKHFLNKYDQIRSFLRFWKHLLKKSSMENFVFLALEFELVTGKKGIYTPLLIRHFQNLL